MQSRKFFLLSETLGLYLCI